MNKKKTAVLISLVMAWAVSVSAGAMSVHFTQIGSGTAGSLTFRTVFQITNENLEPAEGSMVLNRSDGTAMEPNLELFWVNRAGEARTDANRLQFTIPSLSSLRVVLPPGPAVVVGWATLQCAVEVSASAVTQFAEVGGGEFEGRLISEVETSGSPGLTAFSFPLAYVPGTRPVETAFALANPSPIPATVTLLRRPAAETSIVLEPGAVYSVYLSQIWPEAAGGARYDGLAEVRSSVPLGSLVFRTLAGLPLSGVAAGPSAAAAQGSEAGLNEEFTLALNQTAEIAEEALAVTFTGVAEDSRCPSDVTCIWEGQARVSVRLTRNGNPVGEVELTLRAGNVEMATATLGGYVVQAVRLDPYPVSTEGPIKAEDYRLTLVVRPAE